MSTYVSIVREMTAAPDIQQWWNANIAQEEQEDAAGALRAWLRVSPNRIENVACGDWINGSGGWVAPVYRVNGMELSTEQQMLLYNFLNRPIRIEKQFAYTSIPRIEESDCLDKLTFYIRK
jgi:hypothetical protein